MQAITRIAVILGVSVAAGIAQKFVTGHPWIPDREQAAKIQERKDVLKSRHGELRATVGVSYEEFQSGVAGGALVLDARPAEEFAKAHLSVDGPMPVLNVEPSPEKFPANLDRLMPFQGVPILIYCTSNECELGEELYIELERVGFFDMKIYFPGWDGLVKAGAKQASGPDTWTAADSQTLMLRSTDNPAPAEQSAETGAVPEAEQP